MTPDANLLVAFCRRFFFIKNFFLISSERSQDVDDENEISLSLFQSKLVWSWMGNQFFLQEPSLLAFLFVLLVVHGNPLRKSREIEAKLRDQFI